MPSAKSASPEAEAKTAAKQRKTQEARHAMNDYQAVSQHRDANTLRLRALRLAKEAAEEIEAKEHAAEKAPATKKKAPAVKKPRRAKTQT